MTRTRIFIIIAVIGTLLLFILPMRLLEYTPGSTFISVVKEEVNNNISAISRSISILSRLHDVGRENAGLRREVANLRVQLLLNRAIKKENEELSKLLKIKDNYSKYTIIPSKILNYSPVNPNRVTVSFPEEYARHMAEKATVVSSMGMVGLVTEYTNNTAEVILITSKRFTVPAVLENRDECTGVLKGNGQSMSLLFLDNVCNNPSATGARLLSANLSQNYSLPYIPIGIIGQVNEDPANNLFVKGNVIPLFKKGKLNHLFIIVGTTIKDEKFLY